MQCPGWDSTLYCKADPLLVYRGSLYPGILIHSTLTQDHVKIKEQTIWFCSARVLLTENTRQTKNIDYNRRELNTISHRLHSRAKAVSVTTRGHSNNADWWGGIFVDFSHSIKCSLVRTIDGLMFHSHIGMMKAKPQAKLITLTSGRQRCCPPLM